ncbi:GNAT family N-acetyltransferase [Oceanicella sp. SM1341]|uniref:GNAT family N-acetyltransferase n=1 Tax=Oceanicella sp. SM1341 TaxID=1548889 RepID=UPI000E51AA89|nr:GNAT family N-acetyltransferase [Oceanicella sp. SM1341]
MSAAVRPLGPDDHAAWRGLFTDYLTFYRTTRPEEVYTTTWARLMDPEVRMHGALAVAGGRPVGLVQWLYHLSTWEVPARAYLNDLYVSEAARGTGAGRALIEHVYADADAHGAATVYWTTEEDNATARRLYDRIGTRTPFIKYGR